jgi:hypothetical protein
MSYMDCGVSELYKNTYLCKEVYCNGVVCSKFIRVQELISRFQEKINNNELGGEQCAQTPVPHVL